MRKKDIFQAIFFSFLCFFMLFLYLNFTLNIFLPKITSKINNSKISLISYKKIEPELFPYPGLKISNLKFKKEKTVDLILKTTEIYLNFLGITSNKFLGLKVSDGTIFVYNLKFDQKKQKSSFSIPKIPVEFIELSNINVNAELQKKDLKLEDVYVYGALKKDKIIINSHGRSNLAKNFNIEAEIFENKKRIKAKLTDLNASNLLKILPKHYFDYKDISGLINTDIEVYINNNQLTAKIDTSSKELNFGGKIKDLDLKLIALIDEKTHQNKIQIKDLHTRYPYINLAGEIEISPNKINTQLSGKKISIFELREFYQKFPFKNQIADTIFAIGRSGVVYNTSFNLTEINGKSTWSLEGECRDTDILIPSLELPLKNVSSKLTIKNNILMSRDIKGFYRNSKIQNGYLDLGLNGKLSPFVINTQVYFDLKDLKPLLKSLKVSDNITYKLEKIDIASGNCTSYFTLNKKSEKYLWKVDAKNLHVNARLQNKPIKLSADLFSITPDNIYVKNANINLKRSKLKHIVVDTDLNSNDIKIVLRRSKINIKEIKDIASHFLPVNDQFKITGNLFFNRLKISYNYKKNKLKDYLFLGSIFNFNIKSINFKNKLPKKTKLRISRGNFSIYPKKIKLTSLVVDTLKSNIKLNYLELLGDIKNPKSIKMDFSGDVSIEAQKILKKIIPYMELIKTEKMAKVKNMKVTISKQDIKVNGDVVLNDVFTNLNIEKETGKLSTHIDLTYAKTKCSVKFTSQKEKIFIDFKGDLTQSAVDRLVVKNPYLKDKISGDFSLSLSLNPFYIINSNGYINMDSINIDPDIELSITHMSATSINNMILIKKFLISLYDDEISLDGTINLIKGLNKINIKLRSNSIHLDHIINNFNKKQDNDIKFKIAGSIDIDVKNVFYKDRSIRDIRGKVLLNNGFKELNISRAYLCELPIKAIFKNDKNTKKLEININSSNFSIQDTLHCLICNKKTLITGTSKINITITSLINENDFIKTMNGDFLFQSKDGRIFKLTLISHILTVINSTSIFFGKIPDLGKIGFGYNDILAQGIIKDGCLFLKKFYINATNMELALHGKIELNTKKINLLIFFAPLKTIDRIVKKIPILREITGGNLMVIPFQAKGTIDSPIIIPLSPKAVGTEAIGILKNTIKLPFTIFQPLVPNSK